jgi:RNA polymerase sigma factor (sigma-70 family)
MQKQGGLMIQEKAAECLDEFFDITWDDDTWSARRWAELKTQCKQAQEHAAFPMFLYEMGEHYPGTLNTSMRRIRKICPEACPWYATVLLGTAMTWVRAAPLSDEQLIKKAGTLPAREREQALWTVVIRNLGLAGFFARKENKDLTDMIHPLWKAVSYWNPEKARLSTSMHFFYRPRGDEGRDGILVAGKAVDNVKHTHEWGRAEERAGRAQTTTDLAERAGMDPLVFVIASRNSVAPGYRDTSGKVPSVDLEQAQVPTPLDLLIQKEPETVVADLLESVGLTARQQLVIRGRYYEDKSLSEIAPEIGASRERVRQIQNHVLLRARHPVHKKAVQGYDGRKEES